MARIWAHRGASAYAPENTIEAFQKAIEMGAQGIELDVHMSADGALVVIHDESVHRTSGFKGEISEMNLTQLKRLHFNKGFEAEFPEAQIPTLQEVYELIRPTGLLINVEIKTNREPYPGIEKKLLTMERNMGMKGRILYSSFNHYTLRNLREIDPKASMGVLYSNELVEPWNYAKYLGARALHPAYDLVLRYPGYVECAHADNLLVNVWTVDTSNDIRRLMELGVDVIITNKPNIGVEELRRFQGESGTDS